MRTIQKISPAIHFKIFTHSNKMTEEEKHYYNETFKTWKNVWSDVFSHEMNLNARLFSNDFTRQHHILSLFFGSKCVGTVFMREVDFSLVTTIDDSYFRFWPEDILHSISDENSQVVIVSNFTIDKEFRQSQHFEWKTLLMCLFVDYFKTLNQPLMISAARKLKSNEKLCYQLGAKCLLKDVAYKSEGSMATNEMTDIVCWKPNVELSLTNRELQFVREELISSFSQEKIHAKKIAA